MRNLIHIICLFLLADAFVFYSCLDGEDYMDGSYYESIEQSYLLDVSVIPCDSLVGDCYGVCSHITRSYKDFPYIKEELDIMRDLGISWVRSDVDWVTINPSYGVTETQLFDSVRSLLEMYPDVHLLPIITPRASFAKKETGVHAIDYQDSFIEYIQSVSTIFKGLCPYWEGINEQEHYIPELITYKDGVQIARDIYKAVHSVDSEAKVLNGSFMGTGKTFLNMIEYGMLNYSDDLNQHIYPSKEPEFTFQNAIVRLSSMYNEYGINKSKKLWVTETGYSTAEAEGRQTEEEQAYYIPRLYITGLAYGASKIFWYNLRSAENKLDEPEDNFGILHNDLSPKPAYYAYKNLTHLLSAESTRPKLCVKDSIFFSSWNNPSVGKVYAIWKYKGQGKIKLRVIGDSHAYYYNDLEKEIEFGHDEEFVVSEKPIYVIGADYVIWKNYL